MAQLVEVDNQIATRRARCRLEDMEERKRDIQHLATHMDSREAMVAAIPTVREAHNNSRLDMDLRDTEGWGGATARTQ